jgi:alanine or glycine:cation symporter, AGCS family
MDWFVNIVDTIHIAVWGAPLLIAVFGVGIYMTFLLKGIQFRYLFYAIKLLFTYKGEGSKKGDITPFQALMTALASDIGISNIAGVATAVMMGGLGAIFWIWVVAFVGMASRFAESLLAVKYREVNHYGTMSGGPMFFISRGLGWKWLAVSFAFFGCFAAIGGGNLIQANSIADALNDLFGVAPLYTGIALALLTGTMLIGGIKNIGRAASFLVPIMGVFYLIGGMIIILLHINMVPSAIILIIKSAFTGQAATGGFVGSGMIMAMRFGTARGIASTEAGMGSGAIAAAAAQVDTPGRQAMISMTGTFFAAFVICTITGLVLAVTGVVGATNANGVVLNGAPLTVAAFNDNLPGGGYIVTLGLIFFGYTTVMGWAYYGEKCMEYMFGYRSIYLFRVLFTLVLIPGAMLGLDVVWKIADITNGMMALPNLIALAAMSKIISAETKYFLKIADKEIAAK